MSPIVLCTINGKFCNHTWFMMCSMRILILVSGEAAGFGFTNSHCSTHDGFVGSESRHYDLFPTSQLVWYWFLIRSRHSTHLNWWSYVSAWGTWLKHWTLFWSISTAKVVFTDLWYEVDDQLTCLGEFGSLPRVLLFYECSMWKILQSHLVCGMLYRYIRSTLSEPCVIFRPRD